MHQHYDHSWSGVGKSCPLQHPHQFTKYKPHFPSKVVTFNCSFADGPNNSLNCMKNVQLTPVESSGGRSSLHSSSPPQESCRFSWNSPSFLEVKDQVIISFYSLLSLWDATSTLKHTIPWYCYVILRTKWRLWQASRIHQTGYIWGFILQTKKFWNVIG